MLTTETKEQDPGIWLVSSMNVRHTHTHTHRMSAKQHQDRGTRNAQLEDMHQSRHATWQKPSASLSSVSASNITLPQLGVVPQLFQNIPCKKSMYHPRKSSHNPKRSSSLRPPGERPCTCQSEACCQQKEFCCCYWMTAPAPMHSSAQGVCQLSHLLPWGCPWPFQQPCVGRPHTSAGSGLSPVQGYPYLGSHHRSP